MPTLVQQTARRTALETQLVEHHDAFLAFVRKRIADRNVAADVLQDSFLKALRAKDSVRDTENVIAWFYRILRRTIIDVYRRRAASDRALERFKLEMDIAANARDHVAACECLALLLPTLKPQYAAVLRQVDLDGASPARVARQLGISPNNLKVRLHRARKQLRQHLRQSCELCAADRCRECECDAEAAS